MCEIGSKRVKDELGGGKREEGRGKMVLGSQHGAVQALGKKLGAERKGKWIPQGLEW